MFSHILGVYSLDARSTPYPHQDNKKCPLRGQITPAETQRVTVMAKWVNPCDVLRAVPGTECALVNVLSG